MAKAIEISETKIRQAIWMQKANKTKKSICEHLGIAYNTKRLDTIIQDFKDKQTRHAELKKKARAKTLSDSEKEGIVKSYQEGESQSAISKQLFLTPQRVKAVLIEKGIPIRARKKTGQATVDHVVQDLDHGTLPQNQQVRMKIRTRVRNDVSPPFAGGPSKASLKSSYHTKSVNSVQQTQEYLTGTIVNKNQLSANQKMNKQVSPQRVTVPKPMNYKFSEH